MTAEAPKPIVQDNIDPRLREQYKPQPARGELGLKADLVMALRFFSRLPTGDSPHQVPDLGRIAMALPLAGLLMSLLPIAILLVGLPLGLPPYFAAALAVAAMVIVGGGMMEDSLADAADGLFGGPTPERRLDILKDSRHGTYGVAALCLFLALRVAAIGGAAAIHPIAAAGIWLAAHLIGRSASLWVAHALPPARKDGASATVGALKAIPFWIGFAITALLALIAGGPGSSLFGVAFALLGAWLTAVGWSALCQRLVGGQTGDLIGAAGGLGEVVALTILLIFA